MEAIAVMNNCGPKYASREAHQTVTEEWIEAPTPVESIRVGFTDQKVSGRAGLASFAGFLHWHSLGRLLQQALPARAARHGPRLRVESVPHQIHLLAVADADCYSDWLIAPGLAGQTAVLFPEDGAFPHELTPNAGPDYGRDGVRRAARKFGMCR